MPRPTIVTGAAGFAGSHLLDLLATTSANVIGWHRPGEATRPIAGVTWVAIELLDETAVAAEIARTVPAAVYHLAGAAHVGQSWTTTTETLQTNVIGTHHLLEAVRAAALDARVLITSSALVYGPSNAAITEENPIAPANPYGLSKVAQEMVGTASGGHRQTYVARPFNHFGPRQSPAFVSAAFAKQIAGIEAGLLPPELRVGNLEARRDLTDVRDTVRGYQLILERGVPQRPYNVCSGRALAVHELLDLLLARARVKVRVVVDPARFRPNDTPIVLGDPSRMRDELGWRAGIAPEQTADDLLSYWRDRTGR
jgi:GDP-4-dehydro-6-deoxy-D-mannose reductase